jgi:hypothetical protein
VEQIRNPKKDGGIGSLLSEVATGMIKELNGEHINIQNTYCTVIIIKATAIKQELLPCYYFKQNVIITIININISIDS